MKQLLSVAVAAILVTTALPCIAQPAPPREPRKGPAPREGIGEPLQQVTAIAGTVANWVNNDDFIYDGFYLQSSAGRVLVKFPPHLGAQLVKELKQGASITVNGVEALNPEGVKETRMVNIVVNGQTIADTPPAPPTVPPAESAISGSGKITALKMDREGRVNGFMVDNKIILKTPPHVAAQLTNLLSTGTDISFTGFKKPANNGEAMVGNYSIVHCQTITIKGTQYLVN